MPLETEAENLASLCNQMDASCSFHRFRLVLIQAVF
jgi:hypothetical protein